jgi:hypothetical protein
MCRIEDDHGLGFRKLGIEEAGENPEAGENDDYGKDHQQGA